MVFSAVAVPVCRPPAGRVASSEQELSISFRLPGSISLRSPEAEGHSEPFPHIATFSGWFLLGEEQCCFCMLILYPIPLLKSLCYF